MQEEQVSRSGSVSSSPAVDRGRREALVRLGTYSALATPAMMALLTEKSIAQTYNGSGGGGGGGGPKPPKPPKKPK
jgi:hypothetical protein